MSVGVGQVWEMRPTNGVDTNGGGFVTGSSGTDWSQQNAAQYSLSSLTTSGASATIATTSAANDMVGNIIQITAGTNFTTGFYQIISVVVGTSITVDRNATTGVGAAGTGNIGGALKTFSKLFSAMTGGVAWCKAEATVTETANLSVNFSTSASVQSALIGYTSTRGDNGYFTVQAITNTNFQLMSIDNNNSLNTFVMKNFILDCNSKSGVSGMKTNSNYSSLDNIKVINMSGGTGFNLWQPCQSGTARRCYVINMSGGTGFDTTNAINGTTTCIDCGSSGSSGTNPVPWNITAGTYIRCFAANNTGGTPTGVHGFTITANPRACTFENCVSYTNGGDGFHFAGLAGNAPITVLNCVSYGNGVTGFNNVGGTVVPQFTMIFDYTYAGGNTTSNYASITAGPGAATLTADPFVNGASLNFAPNSTAGGGAVLRAAGYPGVLPVGGTGFLDGGLLQHQDVNTSPTDVINQVITNYYGGA